MHRGWVGFIQDHHAPWPAWGQDRIAASSDREPSIGPAFELETEIVRTINR